MSTQPEALRLADALEDSLEDYSGSSLPRRCQSIADEAAAELRRLHQHELALIEWLEKTHWVQAGAQAGELGRHRADVIQMRVARLHALNRELLEALKDALCSLEVCGKDFDHTMSKARAAIAKATGATSPKVSRIGTTAKFYPVQHLPSDDTEGGAA